MQGLALSLMLVAMVAGCTRDEPLPTASPISPTSAPTIAPAHLPEGWERCVNDRQGWSIGYPQAWFTTSKYTDPLTGKTEVRPDSACTLFDPNEFTIPRDGEPPDTALQVGISTSPLDAVVDDLTDPTYWRTLSREDWSVIGMPAVKLEVAGRGGGLVLKGTLRYGWVIDLAPGSFLVFAVALPGTGPHRYLEYRRIAERAVATLEVVSPTD